MIRYNHLLYEHSGLSMFWKTTLERLSIGDAPFFSQIKSDIFSIGGEPGINLKTNKVSNVVNYCKEEWEIPEPLFQWKDIKKENTRNLLLKKFAEENSNAEDSSSFFLRLQMMMNEKKILPEDVMMMDGSIVDIRIPDYF